MILAQLDGRGRELGFGIEGPAYAIDDETAIQVNDGVVDIVSEGNWTLF